MVSSEEEEVQNDEKVFLQIAKHNGPAKMDDFYNGLHKFSNQKI